MNQLTDIDKRIAEESTAISAAETKRAGLEARRRDALEAGHDAAVDAVDAELRNVEVAIARANERSQLLHGKRQEAVDAQAAADLDALVTKANVARTHGEKLIGEYAKHADAIGGILRKLTAIDQEIEIANTTLTKQGREGVASPNRVRCKATLHGTRTEHRRVGVGEIQHPLHTVAVFDLNGQCRHRDTGEPIAPFGEFDVETSFVTPGYFPAPLQREVVLPKVDADSRDYWPAPHRAAEDVGAPNAFGTVRRLFGSKAA